MYRRMSVTMVALAGVMALPALAQEQYALQMKFTPGDVSETKVTVTGVGTLTVDAPGAPNQPSDLWMNMQIDLSQETKSVDSRGVGELAWKLGALDAEINAMGMRQNIFFQDGHLQIILNDQIIEPEELNKNPMMALIGQGFTIKQDRTGKIVGLPQLELLIKMMMPDSDLEGALEQGTGPLPPGPVKMGDTWEERQVWPYGWPEGTERPVFVTTHTLEGLETVGGHQCAKISSASAIDLKDVEMPVPTMMPQMGGAKILSMALNRMALDLTGTHYFDIERGITRRMDTSMTLNMDMKQKLEIPAQPANQPQAQGAEGQPQPGQADTEAPATQAVEIGVKIEDLILDLGIELVQ